MIPYKLSTLFLFLVLITTSCKSCKEKEIPCICNVNEVCIEGNCVCAENFEMQFGSCVASSKYGEERGEYYYKPSFSSCFTFDSVLMFVPKIFTLADTSVPTMILDGVLELRKPTFGYHLPDRERPFHRIDVQNAWYFKDSNGYGVRFNVDNFIHTGGTFRPLTEYGDTLTRTNWNALFSSDFSRIKAKVVLYIDKDRRWGAETPVDSCEFTFERY